MTTPKPLARLILQAAERHNLGRESQQALLTHRAKDVIQRLLPAARGGYTLSYKDGVLFIGARDSALASELHMRVRSIKQALTEEVPHIPCRHILVRGKAHDGR